MNLEEKYEIKCQEAARYKADVRRLQDEVAALRDAPVKVERVEVLREVKVPVEVVREVQVDRPVCIPAVDIARGMSGTNADKVKALEAALGVALSRLRDAGLDANIKGLEWGSD